MKQSKFIKPVIVVALLALIIAPSRNFLQANGGVLQKKGAERISELVQGLWSDKKCAENISKYTEYTVVSIACVGDYTAMTRKRVLDIFFKSGLTLIKESYQVEKKSGLYLYKLEDKTDPYNYQFYKIYVRNARILWPVHERLQPQIGIFVQNLSGISSLLRWQTLGVPVSYGVLPQKGDSTELFKKIIEYGQELWITLILESEDGLENDYRTITVDDAKDPDKLSLYFDNAIPKNVSITGVSSYHGSLFMKDIFSLRNLFSQLRKRGIHHFLDTQSGDSGGYDTARIMSMKSFRTNVYIQGTKSEMEETWDRAIRMAKTGGTVIVLAEGDNEEALAFLKTMVEKHNSMYEFSFVSELPYN
ncbi:MAG: divergent polysaccharide deacetylase family protein [Leptospirales bacterium]